MGILMKMLMSGAAITVAATVQYIIKHAVKGNLRSIKQMRVKQRKWQNIEKVYPILHDSHWKRIGKVVELDIYPVKSSKEALTVDSCDFRDYGMCLTNLVGAHLWDGMFIVYNKTKDKFEDSRRYPLLQYMTAVLLRYTKVRLHQISVRRWYQSWIDIDIDQDCNSSNRFVKKTWSGTLEAYYSLNKKVNTWVKNTIRADEINGANEDVILAYMPPHNWDSTQKIRDNWFHFVQGYNTMEENETGEFITLPRFVLITTQNYKEFLKNDNNNLLTRNIIVETDEPMSPFAEKYWDLIRIGNNVILKNVKLAASNDKKFQHYEIYCGLWSGGKVKLYDEVFIHCDDTQPKCERKL